jgi:glycosyltransferase involved in cell wall biosynthesis
LISILIPIHNTKISFIKDCLDSIESQTLKDYEVIIINDGSDIEVTEFLKSISNKKYKIYHREKLGISNALNYGISECKYDIIARMDADDIMLPNRLRIQYDYLNHNKDVDILGSQMEIFGYKTGVTNHPLVIDRNIILTTHWFMNHPTVMFKKNIINKIGGYDSSFDGLEDLELWCRALYNGCKLEYLKDVLLRYRIHRNNKINRVDKIKNILEYYLKKL